MGIGLHRAGRSGSDRYSLTGANAYLVEYRYQERDSPLKYGTQLSPLTLETRNQEIRNWVSPAYATSSDRRVVHLSLARFGRDN